MNSLVLMACSATKGCGPAPAFDLYQGVMYQTFRAHVKPEARPGVLILSAMHGFVAADEVLEPYDMQMTQARADEMLANLPGFMGRALWPDDVGHVLLAGGKAYRRVMRAAVEVMLPQVPVDECAGGIGYQRAQLGQYLDSLVNPAEVTGYHANGTPLLASLCGFEVGDPVLLAYRAAPWVAHRKAVIRALFIGPSGPTADVDLIDGKRAESRWIGVDNLRCM